MDSLIFPTRIFKPQRMSKRGFKMLSTLAILVMTPTLICNAVKVMETLKVNVISDYYDVKSSDDHFKYFKINLDPS